MAQKTRSSTSPVNQRLFFLVSILLVLALAVIAIWLWYDRKITSLDHPQQAHPVPSSTRFTQ